MEEILKAIAELNAKVDALDKETNRVAQLPDTPSRFFKLIELRLCTKRLKLEYRELSQKFHMARSGSTYN